MTFKQPRIAQAGALLWFLNIQYFIAQIVVANAWPRGSRYNWGINTISDLANTRCGTYGSRFVCSPRHALMNVSFIAVGVTIIAGAILLQRGCMTVGRSVRVGFWFMAAAGAGAILIGLFPENTIGSLHVAGATLSFFLGNAGMILIGYRFKQASKIIRLYAALSGVIGLVALVLFLKHVYLGLSIGGMERVVAYPQTIWMIIFGTYILTATHKATDTH